MKGRTMEEAVWHQGLLGEWASTVGKSAITVLFDISKTFEHIRHDCLWEEAAKLGFSPVVLLWLLRTFRFLGGMQLGGGCPAKLWLYGR